MSILDTVKLGRTKRATIDPRTIQYEDVRSAADWSPPLAYDFDAERGNVFPARMYRNDVEGDCVKAAQANHQTRVEYDEQGVVIDITDQEVHDQYRAETGGPDVGLDPISSLNVWRRGWTMAGKVYRIHSWAQVRAQDRRMTSEAIIVGSGLQGGLLLPVAAGYQFDRHEMWEPVAGPDGVPNGWGGHMAYIRGYDAVGVTLWTWGRVQRASWRWLAEYSDFAALVVDDIDRFGEEDIDKAALASALENIP